MAYTKGIASIEKLDANNYLNWWFKIKLLLIREVLFDVITDKKPDPLTSDWNWKDGKAKALIKLSIEDGQIINIKHLNKAWETWDTLKNIHERSHFSNKLHLLRKLYSTNQN